jgi:hypothetical protein
MSSELFPRNFCDSREFNDHGRIGLQRQGLFRSLCACALSCPTISTLSKDDPEPVALAHRTMPACSTSAETVRSIPPQFLQSRRRALRSNGHCCSPTLWDRRACYRFPISVGFVSVIGREARQQSRGQGCSAIWQTTFGLVIELIEQEKTSALRVGA